MRGGKAWSGRAGGVATAVLVLLQIGGGPTLGGRGGLPGPGRPAGSGVIDEMNAASRRGLAPLPPAPAASAPPVWVPERTVPTAREPAGLRIPGHWERPLPGGGTLVPPLVACDQLGTCYAIPGGVWLPPERRWDFSVP